MIIITALDVQQHLTNTEYVDTVFEFFIVIYLFVHVSVICKFMTVMCL